ncbi:MAG TPA: hypothetical protein VFK02_07445, partial [Kofleriaceae bacterium]|nr:hypothetical protein [Kofleriaceae bacterium]
MTSPSGPGPAPPTPADDAADTDLGDLGRLGWNADWDAARTAADPDAAWQPVRIAAEHRGA